MIYRILYQLYGYPDSRYCLSEYRDYKIAATAFNELLKENSTSHRIELVDFPMLFAKLTDPDGYVKILWITEKQC